MKLLRLLSSLTGATLAVALTLALRLPAQDPVEDPTPPATPNEAPAAPDAPAAADTESDADAALRELTAEEPAADAVDAADAAEAAAETVVQVHRTHYPERVGIGSNVLHAAGSTAQTVVAVMADALVDGDVEQEAVTVLGDLTINGHVEGEAVNVLGHLTINGEVEGDVAAVLASVQLGPNAHVHGDFTSVGGAIQQAPGARIDGDVQEIPFMGDAQVNFDWLKAWVKHCLRWGRPLWFGENLGWVWMLTGAAFLLYLFIALIVPRPVARCAQTMEQHPGFSLLTAVLSLLLMPLLMIVLAVTGVGPALLALFMFFVGLFGKTVFFAWLGRRFSSDPDRMAVPLAVLIGGTITIIIYLIPFAGFAFQKLSGFLGSGIVIYTMIQAMQSDRPKGPSGGTRPAPAGAAPTPPPSPVTPPPAPPPVEEAPRPASAPLDATASASAASAAAAGGAEGVADTSSTEPPPAPTPPPPPPSGQRTTPPPMHVADLPQLSTLPRAGFWARAGAALIDVILIGIVLNLIETRHFHVTDYFLAWAGLYHIVMWGLKGTTVGGIVLGLKVVRLDDRPMDWSIAIVRGLGSFISLFVIGIGFAWVAFDPERQSWHDKIAGTTIVRVPKGVSLI